MTDITFIEPDTVPDVLEILSHNSGAHIVAGGQFLVEQLVAHKIVPHTLISLRRVSRLCGFTHSSDGSVLIGAMTTHRAIAETDCLRGSHRLLSEAARQIAGPAIRNVATIGGSICCADASLDYPAVLATLDACVRIVGPAGERTLPILDFYAQKGIRDEELLVEVQLPPSPTHSLALYERVVRCEQDVPILSVALHISMKRNVCCAAAIGLGS
ncbi:MAG: FAD binding domain-containing protein, partial [Arenicellales bacterium]